MENEQLERQKKMGSDRNCSIEFERNGTRNLEGICLRWFVQWKEYEFFELFWQVPTKSSAPIFWGPPELFYIVSFVVKYSGLFDKIYRGLTLTTAFQHLSESHSRV